jgi:hypothetical protein
LNHDRSSFFTFAVRSARSDEHIMLEEQVDCGIEKRSSLHRRLTLRGLVRRKGHSGGEQGKEGNKLKGLHGGGAIY